MTKKKEKELVKLLEELWCDCNNGAMYNHETNDLCTTPNNMLRNKTVAFIESIGHKTDLKYIKITPTMAC